MQSLIEIQDLKMMINSVEGPLTVIKNINLNLNQGQSFVLLGGSGSGKTMTALSLLQLVPNNAFYDIKSRILYHPRDFKQTLDINQSDNFNQPLNLTKNSVINQPCDLLNFTEAELQKLRGADIAMIFQEPMTALNPVLTIGEQINEVLRLHRGFRGEKLKNETLKLIEQVKMPDPERIYQSYPHQLSGGMRQRAMIAMAISSRPKLLIADEPTTALDTSTSRQIIALLKELQQEFAMSMLFITHDIKLATKLADEIAVMKEGEILEQGPVVQIINKPQHPYTVQLLSSDTIEKKGEVVSQNKILEVSNLTVKFVVKKGFFGLKQKQMIVVDDVSFSLRSGETLCIVGESGSGKTTLAKTIVGLIKPTHGQIQFLGKEISDNTENLKKLRNELQMIFQDPFSAMDPRFTVRDLLLEGLLALNLIPNKAEREARIDAMLEQVGLAKNFKSRYPHQLSGGQRQRVCIARALALNPKCLVLDEPTSSLDVELAAQILDLLLTLQKQFNFTYILITHNMSVVKSMAHTVLVMKNGKLVEFGACNDIFNQPKHPYTKTLLSDSCY